MQCSFISVTAKILKPDYTCCWQAPKSKRILSYAPTKIVSYYSFYSYYSFIVIIAFWRRKWQPTPVFLPGESQGWGSLLGCRLWDRTESDTTEVT